MSNEVYLVWQEIDDTEHDVIREELIAVCSTRAVAQDKLEEALEQWQEEENKYEDENPFFITLREALMEVENG